MRIQRFNNIKKFPYGSIRYLPSDLSHGIYYYFLSVYKLRETFL